MGWMYGWDSKAQLVDHLTAPTDQSYEDGRRFTRETLAKSVVGNVLWAVQRYTHYELDGSLRAGETNGEAFIACYKLASHRWEWGYKDMEESMHPYIYSCPLKHLDMAPVKCQDWRDGVRQRLAEKAAKRQRHKSAQVGEYREVLNADIPWVKIVAVTGRKVHGEYGGTVYNVAPRFMGEVIDPARLQAA